MDEYQKSEITVRFVGHLLVLAEVIIVCATALAIISFVYGG